MLILSITTFSVRMEQSLKSQFDALCSDFGMNASTAFNIFARAVVRERKIPFNIYSPEQKITRENAMNTFIALRAEAKHNGLQGMSLDDINDEINFARDEDKSL